MSAPAAPRPDRVGLGIATMLATALVMAFGDALAKRISADFSLRQVYLLRSLFAVPLTVVLLRLGGGTFATKAMRWIAFRSALLMAMWIAFYAALASISLPVVAAAYYTGPLFITGFSALIIREPIGGRRWLEIGLGFLGVLAILRPGTADFSWLALLPVLSAMFYAMAAIVTRVKCAEENPLLLSLGLNLSFALFGAAGSFMLILFGPLPGALEHRFQFGSWAAMGLDQWGIIALMALLIVAISVGVAKAYQSGPPAIIATFDYSYLIFAALWSVAFFAELPDGPTLLGMLLIGGAGLLTLPRPARTAAAMPARTPMANQMVTPTGATLRIGDVRES